MTEYALGEEILWREDSRARKWRVGFLVATRNNWMVIQLRDGSEIEVHPQDIKKRRVS